MSVTQRFYAQLVERDGQLCQFCGETEGLVADHVVPGGPSSLDNLQLLCPPCNSQKGSLSQDDANKAVRFSNTATQQGFTIVSNHVLFDHTITGGARLTWIMLVHYARAKQECWPGQDGLAKQVGVSPKTLRAYLRELVLAGLVQTRKRGQGKTNIYRLQDTKVNGRNDRSGSVAAPVEVRTREEGPPESSTPPEAAAPPRGEVHALVKFYFDYSLTQNRYTVRTHGAILARGIRLAKEAGVTDYDVQGGIKLMVNKGFGPETLGRFIAEYQAQRSPPAKETEHWWDELPDDIPDPQVQAKLARMAARNLFGAASTADDESEPSTSHPSAPTTPIFPAETPTTLDE